MVIRVRGITGRWIFNVLAIVAAVVLIFELTFALVIHEYYYDAVRSSKHFLPTSTTAFFSQYSNATDFEFEKAALQLVESFDAESKNKMEIQVLGRNGDVIVSSTGFAVSSETEKKDYDAATESDDLTGEWIGKNENGEKIMAITYIMPKSDRGHSMGAVRYIVSMRLVDRHIAMIMMILIFVGVVILFFAFISGMYFIGTIVKPVMEVSRTAKRIAMGDFESRLPVRDNDEIGELCDTINYMAGELASAEAMKNDFVSSVSHELRTPLTAIKGWGETIKAAGETEIDHSLLDKGMSIIISESERLSGLVEDLLDFSRMQSGKFTVKSEPTDILAELTEAVYMFEESARRADIELSFIQPNDLSPVVGDAGRLKQVFINIIDNAVKYTPAKGQILVEVSEADGFVKIRVLDTGCGIPGTELEKVKDKFYKANKTVRGSGIGLAVADEIVKLHDGLLFIDSQEGAGTAVTVLLPVKPKSEEDVIDAAADKQKSDNAK